MAYGNETQGRPLPDFDPVRHLSTPDRPATSEHWETLIRRVQRLDPAAFDVTIDEYSARLYGMLCRLTGPREDAEELVQEVFIRVVRMIGRYKRDGRFEAWLFRIATNLARDWIRRARRAWGTSSIDSLPDGDCGRGFVDYV